MSKWRLERAKELSEKIKERQSFSQDSREKTEPEQDKLKKSEQLKSGELKEDG
jgi:hypothetical protein